MSLSVHGSLGELRASGAGARLHLAALYAACDDGCPDARLGATGAKAAADLVRRSSTSRPLSAEEGAALDGVARLAVDAPALRLLCRHLRDASRQLAAFHPPGSNAEAGLSEAVARDPPRTCPGASISGGAFRACVCSAPRGASPRHRGWTSSASSCSPPRR